MADKYLKVGSNGLPAEQAALDSSSGAGDAGKIVALNSSGQIDPTMIGTTESLSLVASEDLSPGDFVNFWNDTGTLKMRKATNTGIGTKADGYVKASVLTAASGIVYRDNGIISGLSSLTVGAVYFLGTAGGVTSTVPTGAGVIIQPIGKGKTSTEIAVFIDSPIVRA